MKKNTDNTQLSNIEWDTLWMAVRYAMNRQTIASASLPADIISNYYSRLSAQQKKMLARDLRENEEDWARRGMLAFGDKDIDRKHWVAFMNCLDVEKHYKVELHDGKIVTVFECGEYIRGLDRYLCDPHGLWYIPKESIKRVVENPTS